VSVRATSEVWRRSRQKGSALLVLLAIADYAHDDLGGAYPSLPTLADKTRLSVRNVQVLLRKLQDAGELVVHIKAGPAETNVYQIVLPEDATFDGGEARRRRRRGGEKLAPGVVKTFHQGGETGCTRGGETTCTRVVKNLHLPLKELRTVSEPSEEPSAAAPQPPMDASANYRGLLNGGWRAIESDFRLVDPELGSRWLKRALRAAEIRAGPITAEQLVTGLELAHLRIGRAVESPSPDHPIHHLRAYAESIVVEALEEQREESADAD
jgi:hypothetical protein